MVLIVYDVVVVPLDIFNLPENWFLTTARWIIRLYWLCDLWLCFTTGYIRPTGTIQMQVQRVAIHYLKTWFTLDIMCIVCDWLPLFSEPRTQDGFRGMHVSRSLTLLRVIRLARLSKAPELEAYISEHISSERFRLVASIAKIIALLLSIAHLIACAWYGLGIHLSESGRTCWVLQYDFEDKGFGERYAVSIHWSLAQMIGENIIVLSDVHERVFAIGTLVFAFISSAVFVSSITTFMTRLQLITSQQSSQFSLLRRYLLQNGISTALLVRVLRNAHHHAVKNSRHLTEDNVDLLKTMSHSLRMEVRFEVYFPVIQAHPFFSTYFSVNPVGIRKVCYSALSSSTVFLGDVVFSQDETPDKPKMYFLLSGYLAYLVDGLQVARLNKEKWACEAVLWTSWIHTGTLQATNSEASYLNVDASAFQLILSKYPSNHAYRYGIRFVEEINKSQRYITDLAGVDITPCLNDAFFREDEGLTEAGSVSSQSASSSRRPSFSFHGKNSNSGSRRPSLDLKGMFGQVASLTRTDAQKMTSSSSFFSWGTLRRQMS